MCLSPAVPLTRRSNLTVRKLRCRSSPSRSPISSRLEEFDEIAGRVLDEDLSTAGPGDDVVAEAYTFCFESSDLVVEFVGDEMDAIPPAGLRPGTVRHRTSRGAVWPAQKDAQVPTHDVGERGVTRVHHEAEMARVEIDGGSYVVDHVADTYGVIAIHWTFLLSVRSVNSPIKNGIRDSSSSAVRLNAG